MFINPGPGIPGLVYCDSAVAIQPDHDGKGLYIKTPKGGARRQDGQSSNQLPSSGKTEDNWQMHYVSFACVGMPPSYLWDYLNSNLTGTLSSYNREYGRSLIYISDGHSLYRLKYSVKYIKPDGSSKKTDSSAILEPEPGVLIGTNISALKVVYALRSEREIKYEGYDEGISKKFDANIILIGDEAIHFAHDKRDGREIIETEQPAVISLMSGLGEPVGIAETDMEVYIAFKKALVVFKGGYSDLDISKYVLISIDELAEKVTKQDSDVFSDSEPEFLKSHDTLATDHVINSISCSCLGSDCYVTLATSRGIIVGHANRGVCGWSEIPLEKEGRRICVYTDYARVEEDKEPRMVAFLSSDWRINKCGRCTVKSADLKAKGNAGKPFIWPCDGLACQSTEISQVMYKYKPVSQESDTYAASLPAFHYLNYDGGCQISRRDSLRLSPAICHGHWSYPYPYPAGSLMSLCEINRLSSLSQNEPNYPFIGTNLGMFPLSIHTTTPIVSPSSISPLGSSASSYSSTMEDDHEAGSPSAKKVKPAPVTLVSIGTASPSSPPSEKYTSSQRRLRAGSKKHPSHSRSSSGSGSCKRQSTPSSDPVVSGKTFEWSGPPVDGHTPRYTDPLPMTHVASWVHGDEWNGSWPTNSTYYYPAVPDTPVTSTVHTPSSISRAVQPSIPPKKSLNPDVLIPGKSNEQ
ncbi:hypothetical protein M3P05_19630 [Sansalvadorimonas sp. 2012CJ34-2]|uniref:Uncharacterized protein n=1 Tax=Parendozoicomonas callyspongiae TaxID=2942213 RepID=A0ABT0PL68_9GAMM|nr:hypothetical protein [Sansalvadorimonas sp. 2012CJ34-2]MCL6272135.1 hypothetical protein [Sansalvadorimonas sp. 2012CJ34-2]